MSSAPTASTATSKLVLVTGGSRGISRATCLLLASKGYDVAVNYASNSKAAASLIQEIEDAKLKQPERYTNIRAAAFQADISKEEEVSKLFDDVAFEFGRDPVGLVNNAGIIGTRNADIASLTKEELDLVMATNVYGPFYCCREFVRRFSKASSGGGCGFGGSIVNVSSGSAYIGNPLLYAMSKGALDSMMAGLSKSLPPHGIRINAVAPGVTATDMVTDEQIENSIPLIPMARAGSPEEIAEAIAFLISDSSSYCSGAKIRIAGGRP